MTYDQVPVAEPTAAWRKAWSESWSASRPHAEPPMIGTTPSNGLTFAHSNGWPCSALRFRVSTTVLNASV